MSQLVNTKNLLTSSPTRFDPPPPPPPPTSVSNFPPSRFSNAVPMGKADGSYLSHMEWAKYMCKPYVLISGIAKKKFTTERMSSNLHICLRILHFVQCFAYSRDKKRQHQKLMIYVSYISLRICLNASHQQVFFLLFIFNFF